MQLLGRLLDVGLQLVADAHQLRYGCLIVLSNVDFILVEACQLLFQLLLVADQLPLQHFAGLLCVHQTFFGCQQLFGKLVDSNIRLQLLAFGCLELSPFVVQLVQQKPLFLVCLFYL